MSVLCVSSLGARLWWYRLLVVAVLPVFGGAHLRMQAYEVVDSWESHVPLGALGEASLSYGQGRWVVVGERGAIVVSLDRGFTWVPVDSGTEEHLNDVHYSGGAMGCCWRWWMLAGLVGWNCLENR